MSESVDIYVKFYDKASAGVRALSGRLKAMGPAGRGAAALVSRGLRTMRQHAKLTAWAIDKIGAAAKRSGRWVGDMAKRGRQHLMRMAKYATMAGVAFAGWQIIKGIKFNAQIESWTQSFAVFYGSVAKATDQIEWLHKFAARTPFRMPQVAAGARQMEAWGLDVRKNLELVGDVAAGTDAEIGQVARALGLIKSGAGGEAAEAFRFLAVNLRNVPGLAFGKGGEMLAKPEEALRVVSAYLKNRFGGMMKKLALTAKGLWSTMVDNIEMVRAALVKPMFERIKGDLTSTLARLTKWRKTTAGEEFVKRWGDALGRGYDKARSFVERMVDLFDKGGMSSVWDDLRPQLEAGVSAAFSALGSLAAKAFLLPFKLALKGDFKASLAAGGMLMMVPGVANAAGAGLGALGTAVAGAKGSAAGAAGIAGLLPIALPIIIPAVVAYMVGKAYFSAKARAVEADSKVRSYQGYRTMLGKNALAGQVGRNDTEAMQAMSEFRRLTKSGTDAATAYFNVMAKYGQRQTDVTRRLEQQIPKLAQVAQLERERAQAWDAVLKSGRGDIASARGRTAAAIEEFQGKRRTPEQQQALGLERIKSLSADIGAIKLGEARGEDDLRNKLRTRLELIEKLRGEKLKSLELTEKIREQHQRTAEVIAGMSAPQRHMAAGLREFLKTATVEQFGRLGDRGMGMVQRIPELQQLVQQRGLATGLAGQFGFGAPAAGGAAGGAADAGGVLAEINKMLDSTKAMLEQTGEKRKAEAQAEAKENLLELNIPEITVNAILKDDGAALVETLRSMIGNLRAEMRIQLEQALKQRDDEDRAKANEAESAL